MTGNDDFLRELEVFQFCDSTFPVGTFNHSYGMENFLTEHAIKKAPDFAEWLRDYFRAQFASGEGLAVLLCDDALAHGDPDTLCFVDEMLTASTAAYETRRGGILIAGQMMQLMERIYGEQVPHLGFYREAIKEGRAFGNPAVVFTLLSNWKGVPRESAYLLYGYNVASTLVQNAVRSIPLGQKDGQEILHRLIEDLPALYARSAALTMEDLGTCAPGLEIAQIRHETQGARLFMS